MLLRHAGAARDFSLERDLQSREDDFGWQTKGKEAHVTAGQPSFSAKQRRESLPMTVSESLSSASSDEEQVKGRVETTASNQIQNEARGSHGESDRKARQRERSNSVPDLLSRHSFQSDQDQSPAEPASQGEPLQTHEDGTPPAPLKIDLAHLQRTLSKRIQSDSPPTPLMLTSQNSITPSLELQRPPLGEVETRGYPWRKAPSTSAKRNRNSGKYVSPDHRNPTAVQAFYDTHFGSSSGFRSVAGMADDFFHPIGSAKKSVLNRIAPKSHKEADKGDPSQKESLMSWRNLPFSPSIFTSASSPTATASAKEAHSLSNAHSASERNADAYEPELIPTIHRDPHANRYFKALKGNVVVMGGYRGSVLRDANTHQMIWVPLKVGVGLRRPTLELGLTQEAEDRSEETVMPDEMLSAIGNMVDSGKRLIARCSRKDTHVFSFGFDWRLSLARSSKRLHDHLEQLWIASAADEKDRKGAKVIAHSMGGLVALHALSQARNPRIFDAVIFASTPFLGTANILGPFAFGDAALWNDEICSPPPPPPPPPPRATFSFRSSFYLLPVDPKEREGIDTAGGRCFEEEDGTPHDVDFLDPRTWDDLGLSKCIERGRRRTANANKSTEKATSGESASLDKAEDVPAFPMDIQMKRSNDADENESDRQREAKEVAKEGVRQAVKVAQGDDDTEQTLQPANRKEQGKSHTSAKNSSAEQSGGPIDGEEHQDQTWEYLERTLGEARQFFHELRTSFRPEFARKGLYPPIALLTSGRTPTVRGALVWPHGSAELEKQEASHGAEAAHAEEEDDAHWKRTVRLGDYSRMLYAPGDGVILRKSSVTLPGQWGTLLVRGKASADESGANPLTNDEGVVETSHRHVTLLSDVDGIGRCLEACRRARDNGRIERV